MISYSYVDEFLELYRSGKIVLNKERIMLIEWLERDVLTMDDIYFDGEQIENYIKFTEKYYFPLQPFQKFLTCFVFLFYDTDELVFDEHFHYEARGAGKNGYLSSLSNYFISDLHGVDFYNVSIVANSEKQAKTSFAEVYNKIDMEEALQAHFSHKKAIIESRKTKSVFQFHTSNASTKDGLRDGCVIFDEIHQYENSEVVDVFTSGLGKVKYPRIFYVGTDGYVRDGYIDKLKERARNILEGRVSVREDGLFPFMCCIDKEEEMHDSTLWQKANPMFHEPMSDYAKNLFRTVKKQYQKLENDPSGYEEFVTKRMNLPKVDLEKSVAAWEEILATNRPMPELMNEECIGCLDFASIRDFAAVGLLFRDEQNYMFKTHSFVRKEFVDKHYSYSKPPDPNSAQRKMAPIKEWEEQGLLTVIDAPTIQPQLIVDWFVKMREHYIIKKIVADNFRMEILKPLFEAEGFIVEVIRNPRAIHSLLAPRIETAFANRQIIFGDNPLMRWYVNNTLVIIDKRGNKEYGKKEPVKRKTDGFQCFVHGMYRADEITIGSSFSFADISF